MIHNSSKDVSAPSASFDNENGGQEIGKLRQECESLRRSLAEAKAECDEYRKILYDQLRQQVTEEDKQEWEKIARDVLEHGVGRPVSELQALIDQCALGEDA